MKKFIYILLLAMPALAACTEDVYTYGDPASQLEVSSQYVVFGAEGGTKTVVVASNVNWSCTEGSDWYFVSPGGDGTVTITATANTLSENRYDEITLAGGSLYRTISVAQVAAEGEALGADEGANCYIVRPGTTYRFDATVKGNGLSSSVNSVSAYVSKYGATIPDTEIMCADLLWEAVPDGDRTRSCNVISGNPVYYGGNVYFKSGDAEGNALIAVKNSKGEVLWSWHIWVLEKDPEELEGNGYYWLDRNLGALSCEDGDLNNRGLLYQWGRKDPFLNSYTAYGAASVENVQVGDGSGTWHMTDSQTKLATEAPGNIDYSVKNPMRFLMASSSAIYTWYVSWLDDDTYTCFLWGDTSDLDTYVKSIFDPCPPGYHVPVNDAWYSANNADVNEWDLGTYGVYWTGGNNAYYPWAGFIEGTTGEPSYVGTYGYYWSSGIYEDTYYGECMYCYKSAVYYSSYGPPVYGFPVRCMRTEN